MFNSWTPPAKLWRKQEQEKKQLLTMRIFSLFSRWLALRRRRRVVFSVILLRVFMLVLVDDDEQPDGSEDLHVDVDDDEHGKDDDCHVHTCS